MAKEGGPTWTFIYDASGMRTMRSNGTETYTYAYNNGLLSCMTKGNNTLYFTYDAAGMPLTVNYNGTTYYYVTNLQGDVMVILNSSGVAVVEYTYDAWGKPLTTTGSMASGLGQINPLRYRGYVYDQETGLYYLQSRYYNPEIGRFISADSQLTTGNVIGFNLFSYCNNNPVNSVDPYGNSAIAIGVFIGISTLIGAAVGAFTAACTGGDVLEATIEGAITGAIAATATIFVPQLVAAILPATVSTTTLTIASAATTFGVAATGGFLADIGTQSISQSIRNTPNGKINIDFKRACKTGVMTGVAGIVPTFVDPAQSVLNAMAAATVGMDASVINAVFDIVITLFAN